MNNRDYLRVWRKKNPNYYKTYYKNNREKRQVSIRKSKLKAKYNISIEEYDELLREQKDCCVICGVHQSKLRKRLAVDHRHSDGKVRGLLCIKCNRLLGELSVDEFGFDLINSIIKYIRKTNDE